MCKDDVVDKIVDYLKEENPDFSGVANRDEDLLDSWFVDSLSVLNMVFFLEEEFSVAVERADINADTFANLNTISDYVLKQVD